ncbi:MAG TPA: Uma2 family endonuclease [Tepidisphaeraceae bacterium]|nr:Uma2 family endonuclease [Tepidisphaeraceae bacterium]
MPGTMPTAAGSSYGVPPPGAVLRRFTVEEYHRLIGQGYFAADERYELLNGFIVRKMSRDPIHDAALEIASEVIRSRVPAGWRIRIQSAIATADSEPEPDMAIVRGTPQDHVTRHPGPGELAIVVEVANTSLNDDRTVKGALYARASIGVFWIINLIDRRVEVYTDPTGPDSTTAYRHREDYGIGLAVPLTVGTAVASVPISELLPSALYSA